MKRGPSHEERELWRSAMRGVRPLAGARAPAALAELPPVSIAPRPAPPVVAGPLGTGLDRRSAQRLKRGRMAIDGRLDLHGMTLDEAHDALLRFVARAHEGGQRAVLVITGKGGRDGEGGLRRAVPRWLAEAGSRGRVLAVEPAQPQHGGTGAFYVLLRRKR